MTVSNSLPVIRATFSFAHPRAVIYTNGAFLPVLGLFVLAVVFVIWPEALEHAPISFEKRGLIHHIWHGGLLAGSLLALYGMFSTHTYRLFIEFVGLLMVTLAMALNLIAQTGLFLEHGTASVREGVTGVGLDLRVIVIAILVLRLVILVRRPMIDLPGTVIVDEG